MGCVVRSVAGDLFDGATQEPGGSHAEVVALAKAAEAARGATAYVTLEPCNHTGRTPPCVDALIAAGVARVVFAVRDPFAAAAHGAGRLAAAGIVVEEGPLADEAQALNVGFFTRITRGTPWVRTKLAASLDGRTALADGASRWITGEAARADGHAWRARACAVLTGVGTVLQDDPQLTVRAVATPRQPQRIVVDRHADTPPTARVLDGGGALVVTAGPRNAAWPAGTETLALPDATGRVDLAALMRVLGEREVNELHVEAGAKLNGALLDAGLVDELLLYVAPSVIGDPARGLFERGAPLAALAGRATLSFDAIDRIGEDLRIVARFTSSGPR